MKARALPPLIAVCLLFGAVSERTHGTDHRDGTAVEDADATAAGALDLNDLFVFTSAINRTNTYLGLANPVMRLIGP